MLQHTVLVLQSLDKERHWAVCWGCRACRLLQGEQAVCAGGLCITQVERGHGLQVPSEWEAGWVYQAAVKVDYTSSAYSICLLEATAWGEWGEFCQCVPKRSLCNGHCLSAQKYLVDKICHGC